MIALLPKDIVTYVYRLVHYDLVEKLNRVYNNSVIDMGTSDKTIDTSYIRLNTVNFKSNRKLGYFAVNYRDINAINWIHGTSIYNIQSCSRVASIPENYSHAPIYTN